MPYLTTRRVVAAALAFVSACDPYTRSTVVTVRDPSSVAVEDADSEARVPAGAPEASAEVARSEVLTGPGSTSDLIVTATRRPGGALVTEWQTRLPLINGERHTLVDATGRLTLDEHVAIDVSRPNVTIPVCGTLAQRASRGVLVGYEVRAAWPCTSAHMTEIRAVTPIENVVSVEHVSRNDIRGLATFGMIMNTLALGGLGTILTFADLKDRDGHEAGAGPKVLGVGVLTLALGVDVALIPAVFGPNKDQVVYPAAP